MIARPITISDHKTAKIWWEGHDWGAIPLSMLPPTGAIVEGICLGYLYISNGGMAHMEWIVANPEKKGREVYKALKILVEKLVSIAHDAGIPAIFTNSDNENLMRLYESTGFYRTETGTTNLLHTAGPT